MTGLGDFEEFVRERQRGLFRFAVALCGDPVLAEDLVQDVLGRAYEQWRLVAAADDQNAYVRRMIVNEFLGRRRRFRRITSVGRLDDKLLPLSPDHADRECDRSELADELASLPPKQRTTLVLRFYAGMSFADVASWLGCRESTARAYATRALAALRIRMTEAPEATLSTAERSCDA